MASSFLYVPVALTLAVISCASSQAETNEGIQQLVAKIDNDVDPRFVYDYEKAKFAPPKGKTLLIMGQSVEAINEYLDNFPYEPMPGGWAAYWAVTEISGVTEAHTNVVGNTHHHQMLVDRFPNAVVHSAMWMVGTWDIAKNTANGKYNDIIRQYSKWAKSTNRPIYLRIGYEFDGPHNALEPTEYVKAYRHIVDLMRSEGVTNIAFVWHSYASPPYKKYPITEWYPGDDYVDWVGISIFGHAYGGPDMGSDADKVLEFARDHKKPVMIAETNPVAGIEAEGTEVWDKWFVNLFSFVYEKNIKAVSFINEDWNRVAIEGIEDWDDARLYNNKQIADAWFQETGKDRYLKASPELFEQLGFSQ